MRSIVILFSFCLVPVFIHAQGWQLSVSPQYDDLTETDVLHTASKKKLYQQNYGAVIGIQRGAGTAIEMGAEMHWRKISLAHPSITGATVNMNYNFGRHVIGYQGGIWTKHGKVNLTYGANAVYYSDFNGLQRFGGGPAVGFRLAGFHLVNGFNFLGGDKELDGANTLYISLRYYFPVSNKFTWDRKTMKAKKERQRERQKIKEDRSNSNDKKGLLNIFNKKED